MMQDKPPNPKSVEEILEDAITESYEIGHAHGGNVYRDVPKRVNDGWGPLVPQAKQALRQLLLAGVPEKVGPKRKNNVVEVASAAMHNQVVDQMIAYIEKVCK